MTKSKKIAVLRLQLLYNVADEFVLNGSGIASSEDIDLYTCKK